MRHLVRLAVFALALAGCSEPTPPAVEASPELAGIRVNMEVRPIALEHESVEAAGWSCEVTPGPYGVALRCIFEETEAKVIGGVHCENPNALSLFGTDGAELTIAVVCAREDGTCFDNRFPSLGTRGDVECPGAR